MIRHPLPSTGSPRRRFPGFGGTMGCSESPPTLSPRFVAFAWRYHDGDAVFVSGLGGRSRRWTSLQPRAGGCSAGCPIRPSSWRRRGVPGSWGTPVWTCPALRPRRDRWARPIQPDRCCLRQSQRRRLPRRKNSFGALSHGPHTGCLRFAVRIAPANRWPTPRKTRFRRLACFAGWDSIPTGFHCKG
jgi:hypothetical protein